jgi:asparagine synthase (glutamine-hydrolysing)
VRWGAYFSEIEKWTLYTDDMRHAVNNTPSAALLEETFQRARANNRLDRTLYTDVNNYLPGALLPKVDRTTMAHSLEARSPFLDHQVMELAACLPVKSKVKGQRTKRILRDTFTDLLPDAVENRRKAGFGVPLGMWFRGPLCQPAKDLLLAPEVQLHRYLRTDKVSQLLEENRRGEADNGKRIWSLLVLESWLRQYRVEL